MKKDDLDTPRQIVQRLPHSSGASDAVVLSDPALRAQLFSSLSKSALVALEVLLTGAESRGAVSRALEGYSRCARMAVAHREPQVIDAVLAALASASSLCLLPQSGRGALIAGETQALSHDDIQPSTSSDSGVAATAVKSLQPSDPSLNTEADDQPNSQPVPAVGRLREKCMLAAAALFSLAHNVAPSIGMHGDTAKKANGWKCIVAALCSLNEMQLLPPELCADEILGQSWHQPRTKISDAPMAPKQSSSFSFTGFVGYLIGAAEPDRSVERARAAELHARKEVSCFNLPSLLARTAVLPDAGLKALIDALLEAQHTACPDEPTADARIAFILQLLAEVTIHNSHRFELVWSGIARAYDKAMLESLVVARSAMIALLRMALRLPSSLPLALQHSLVPLSSIIGTNGILAPSMVEQTAVALAAVVSKAKSLPKGSVDDTTWNVLLSLTAAPDILGSHAAADTSLRALAGLINSNATSTADGDAHVVTGCFASLLKALIAHASADSVRQEHAASAIDLISELQPTLQYVASAWGTQSSLACTAVTLPATVDLTSTILAPHAPWLRVWLPWLRGMSSLCAVSRGPVRDAAVVNLQRALLHAQVRNEPAEVWSAAFEGIVFPLLSELLQRSIAGELDDERLMLRAVTLLSKVLLHHLASLLTLPNFSLLWLRALELLQSYLNAPNNELLLEAVPETLKNMLLVMATAGAFDATESTATGEQSLAAITKAVIDGFCPELSAAPDIAQLWTGVAHESKSVAIQGDGQMASS